MALDKLVDSAQLDSDLEDVADAIRAKSGGEDSLAFPAGFVSEIESISTGDDQGLVPYAIENHSVSDGTASVSVQNNTLTASLPTATYYGIAWFKQPIALKSGDTINLSATVGTQIFVDIVLFDYVSANKLFLAQNVAAKNTYSLEYTYTGTSSLFAGIGFRNRNAGLNKTISMQISVNGVRIV